MRNKKPGTSIKIWDIWIRLFHWLLAGSICFLLISGETGFQFINWHRNVGEFVFSLLLFRLIWGFIGSSNARLVELIVNPRRAISHLFELSRGVVRQDRGHNAAGGWAVLVMLLLISFQAVSGFFIADEDELIEGVFYGVFDSAISERLLYLHQLNSNVLLLLVGGHVLMVFMYLLRAGQNLLTPMITGSMQWISSESAPNVKFARPIVGLVLFITSIGLTAFLVGWIG